MTSNRPGDGDDHPLQGLIRIVGSAFRLIDAGTVDLWRRGVRALRRAAAGPLQDLAVGVILVITGAILLIEDVARGADRALAAVERFAVTFGMAAMAFLAFNEYLARELRPVLGDAGGLWALEGQMNVALLLMVVVGFLGASLATRQQRHIAVNAIDRVLTPGPARSVRRLVALVAAILCFTFARGSANAVYANTQNTFEGATVWSPFVAPVNALVSWMPGDKFGPPSCRTLDDADRPEAGCPSVQYPSGDSWIDAQYDRGLDPYDLVFDDVKLAVRNTGTAPVDVTVILAPSADGTPSDEQTFHVEADEISGFRAIDVTEERPVQMRIGDTPADPVTLLPGQLNTIEISGAEVAVVTGPAVAFGYVDAGDRFPLWIPSLLLVLAFGTMGLRFGAQVFVPGGPTDSATPRPGTRRPADVILAGALPGAVIAIALGTYLGQGWLILLASLLLVFLGAPLFVAVGVGTLACWVLLRDGSAETVVSDMFEATKKVELLAIPFFILAGNLMTQGSMATRLIAIARALLGGLPGGLGAGAVLACAVFAAISGSSPVTVIAIGTIMFPMLVAEGYSTRYSMGVLTTAGGLGIIIPPSIPMIVYAIVVSNIPEVGVVDPATLFKAGLLPGFFIAMVLGGYTLFVHWPREPADLSDGRSRETVVRGWLGELGHAVFRGLPSLMLPVLILGGIYGWLDFGVFAIKFTVTEAAAVAVVYALFVELVVHRDMAWRKLPEVFTESAVMMGSLFLILVIAISLNRFLVWQEVPDAATAFMLSRVETQLGFLLMVNLFLLALGCVMDILSAILIVAPLLAPIAASYGIHPVHFGIMFIVNLELGYLTPPMGINLFVASTVFDRPLLEVIRAVMPFLLLMLFCLAVIVFFPSLSLFLVTP